MERKKLKTNMHTQENPIARKTMEMLIKNINLKLENIMPK